MPFVTAGDGIRVHYQCEGSGPPLLLAHWFAGSGEDWRDTGYVDALRDRFQVILVDARGHGASDKPHDPSLTSADQVARDHIAVLDALGIEQSHFWGYSSGGAVVFAAALLAPERLRSLVIGGTDPWWTPDWVGMADEMIALLRQGMPATLADWEAWLGPFPTAIRQRMLANDPEALAARFANAYTNPGYRERLGEIVQPALLYRAAGDSQSAHAAECAALMPDAGYAELPGLNHATAFYRSDLVLPMVRDFLTRHA